MYLFLSKPPLYSPSHLQPKSFHFLSSEFNFKQFLARNITDHFEDLMGAMGALSPQAYTYLMVDFVGEAHGLRLHSCPGPCLLTLITIFPVLACFVNETCFLLA